MTDDELTDTHTSQAGDAQSDPDERPAPTADDDDADRPDLEALLLGDDDFPNDPDPFF